MTMPRRCAVILVTLICILGVAPATTRSAFRVTVDTSRAVDMKAYGVGIQILTEEWYPKIVKMLPSDGFVAPTEIDIRFEEYDGVAEAAGDRVRCNAKWFRERPEDRGAVIHELVHVVQSYEGKDNPGWLVEGIADYVRFFLFEPADQRPHPKAGKAKYDDSYRNSGAFLDWAQTKYDNDLIRKLNAACREGTYSPKIWKDLTGKDETTLGDEWAAGLEK